MALKGTDLAKKLPESGKKNCKECGLPTCFAFAMKLARNEIEIDKCPYLEPAVRAEVEEALTPPMHTVVVGTGETAIELGGEEVMYRHEKSFLRQPAIAILLSDTETDDQIEEKIRQVAGLVFERAQVTLKLDLLAIQFRSGDPARFRAVAELAKRSSPLSAVLISEDLGALLGAGEVYRDRKPVLYPITDDKLAEAADWAKTRPAVLGLKAEGVEALLPVAEKARELGVKDALLDPSSPDLARAVRDHTVLRRAALKSGIRDLGHPLLAFPCFLGKTPAEEILLAGAVIAKYAGVVIVSTTARELVLPLLLQRMDLYSDPRKLRTVEAKLYEFNQPGADSPVMVTTNYALTYFGVASEAEASRVPAFLAVVDTKGLGVQTAMGAGKFSGDTVAETIRQNGLGDRLKKKRIILPWIASRVKNELAESLPDWDVYIGPKSVNKLSAFLAERAQEWGL